MDGDVAGYSLLLQMASDTLRFVFAHAFMQTFPVGIRSYDGLPGGILIMGQKTALAVAFFTLLERLCVCILRLARHRSSVGKPALPGLLDAVFKRFEVAPCYRDHTFLAI